MQPQEARLAVDSLESIAREFLDFAGDHLYFALFFLLCIEEAGIPLPLPGDTLILLAGSRASTGQANPWIAMTLVVLATLSGSSLLYWVSRAGGMAVLVRVGRWLGLREERLDRVAGWYRRWTGPAIVFGRLVPGFRTPTTVASGTFRVPYLAFLCYTGVSAVIWSGLYLLVGALAQDAYEAAGERLPAPGPVGLLLLAFVVAAAVVAVRRRRRGRAEADDPS